MKFFRRKFLFVRRKKVFLTLALLVLMAIIGVVLYVFQGKYFIKGEDIAGQAKTKTISLARDNTCFVPQTAVPEKDSEFVKTVKTLDTPEKIVAYLKADFALNAPEKEVAMKPEEFFNSKTGGFQDAAVFAAYVLDYHHFEAGVIRYVGIRDGKSVSHAVAVFRNGDTPQYLAVDAAGIEIVAYGWSFADLIKKEVARSGVDISEYAFFWPGVIKLEPSEWVKTK